jgi:hypothetical protein
LVTRVLRAPTVREGCPLAARKGVLLHYGINNRL